jgi:uncharacterized damage-inducible protein DinB
MRQAVIVRSTAVNFPLVTMYLPIPQVLQVCLPFHRSSTIKSPPLRTPLPGDTMPISDLLVTEYDQEMVNTRKTLERVPGEKWDWKPHPKSGTLGWMASHIATLPNFAVTAVNSSELELEGSPRPKVNGVSELLPAFEEWRQKGRDAVASVTDDQLKEIWTLKWKGQVLFAMPKYNVIRVMCFNHIIHHRAQLTMYLRSLDVPVPALYGPSADEQKF